MNLVMSQYWTCMVMLKRLYIIEIEIVLSPVAKQPSLHYFHLFK